MILRYDLKGFPNRLKLICLLVFKLSYNDFKSSDRLGCIQSLSTTKAYTSVDSEKCGIDSSSENLFYFLFNNLAAAVRTFFYVLHPFLLSFQLIHRPGSGRYTVIKTAILLPES